MPSDKKNKANCPSACSSIAGRWTKFSWGAKKYYTVLLENFMGFPAE